MKELVFLAKLKKICVPHISLSKKVSGHRIETPTYDRNEGKFFVDFVFIKC